MNLFEFFSKDLEKRKYKQKIKQNDKFILGLCAILELERPTIKLVNDDYYFELCGYDIKVSYYSYIYISGEDLEHSSQNTRSNFSLIVRSIHESQQTKL